jgi:hypothetical protein
LGYNHRPTNVSATGDPAHVVMPRVHRVASLLERWWLGTHQGATRCAVLAREKTREQGIFADAAPTTSILPLRIEPFGAPWSLGFTQPALPTLSLRAKRSNLDHSSLGGVGSSTRDCTHFTRCHRVTRKDRIDIPDTDLAFAAPTGK